MQALDRPGDEFTQWNRAFIESELVFGFSLAFENEL